MSFCFVLSPLLHNPLLMHAHADFIPDVMGWRECWGVGISCAYIPYHIKRAQQSLV